MELLDRLLPGPPARLLGVGGGPGTYAAPLARRGYRVHLVDPVPLHVEQARQAAGRDPAPGFTAAEGDAREHTPNGLAGEIERAGFTGVAVYGVEGPGWPLRQEWADPRRREQILFAARSVESQPALIGFSHHLIAAATKL